MKMLGSINNVRALIWKRIFNLSWTTILTASNFDSETRLKKLAISRFHFFPHAAQRRFTCTAIYLRPPRPPLACRLQHNTPEPRAGGDVSSAPVKEENHQSDIMKDAASQGASLSFFGSQKKFDLSRTFRQRRQLCQFKATAMSQ